MHKIVVKIGTSTLTEGGTSLSRTYMLNLVEQIVALHKEGKQVVLVSSGAIAAGRELLGSKKMLRSMPSKQMFSSVGQVRLMQLWSELFSLFELHVGQVLLTREDFSFRVRYLNARDTLNCLLKNGIIPVVNENDTVATNEIRVGDNDNLAAYVANLIEADTLILLTDQQGLFTAPPRRDKNAKLIPIVHKINQDVIDLAKDSATSFGTGGMITKLEAAKKASEAGARTVIADASHPNVLLELAHGHAIGTLFLEKISAKESRKRWLLAEKRKGNIYIDRGAVDKIVQNGASLLPSGIVQVEQNFERGDIIQIVSPEKEVIAVGISNYGVQDIQKIRGKRSDVIEKILGYNYGPEVVHRSNMTRVIYD